MWMELNDCVESCWLVVGVGGWCGCGCGVGFFWCLVFGCYWYGDIVGGIYDFVGFVDEVYFGLWWCFGGFG
ncbi:hypothetical protein DF186_17475 [Enterococcus hirae]|nr:hypothetical protein DF186_17475 [Enterococcus hirae]